MGYIASSRAVGLAPGVSGAWGLRPIVIPTFIPTTQRTASDRSTSPWNIVPAQRTFLDVCEHAFEIYDLFEGTEQIQQLVISRAISGVHVR
jgi:hypothetical protein